MKLTFQLECNHFETNYTEHEINEMIAYRISHLLSDIGAWDKFNHSCNLTNEAAETESKYGTRDGYEHSNL